MLDFLVTMYLGCVTEPVPHGMGYHVMKMAERFVGKAHHLLFNNFFSSVQLGQDLEKRGAYICSTVCLNQKGWPKGLNAAKAKKMKMGDMHFLKNGNMVATLWKDKRPLTVLSTNAQPEKGTAERKAPGRKKLVTVLKSILTYNNSIGGVIWWTRCITTTIKWW